MKRIWAAGFLVFFGLSSTPKIWASCETFLKTHLERNGISKVVSAMPGAGKSTLMKMLKEAGVRVADSDSQGFSFLTNAEGQCIDRSGNVVTKKEDRVPNPNFVSDYLAHLQKTLMENDLIFVSAHEQVRDALVKEKIEFDFVRYEIGLKNEVVQRIRMRKSNQPNEIIANVVSSQWDSWMQAVDKPGPTKVFTLKSGQFINDIFRFDSATRSFNPDPSVVEASRRK